MSNLYDIRRIVDLPRYIDFLNKNINEVLVCAAVSDTLFNIDANTKKKLQSIGMTELSVGGWIGYVYINDQGTIKVDRRSEPEKSIFVKGQISNIEIELVSRTLRDGCTAKIFINHIDFAVNWRGLNVVVFDKRNMRLVDSVCFDFLPQSVTPFKRYSCVYCSHVEQEIKENQVKKIKKILPLVHIGKQWAIIQEDNINDSAWLIEKFDQGYHTISIVNKEGDFKRLINRNQFKEGVLKKDYRTQDDLYLEYDEDEEKLKWKLAEMFSDMQALEIPILKKGKIIALGRKSPYFDSKGRWDSRHVYNIHWDWIDESVAKEYFAQKKTVLITSESACLKGFKEAFSSWLDIDVYRDNLLKKCLDGGYDLLISCSDLFQEFPIEQRDAYKLYCILLAETIRRWLQTQGVELHYISVEDNLPGIEKMLSNQRRLVGGTVGYLRDGNEPYFIVDDNDYDKIVGEDNCLPNFHGGRRCVTEANSLTGNGIYFYGPCTAIGFASYSPDENIESFLQKHINEENLNYHVINCGTEAVVGAATEINWLYRIMDTPVRSGDKMIVFVFPSSFWGKDLGIFSIKIHKLINAYTEEKIRGRKCFLTPGIAHMNVTGYEIAAEYIFRELHEELNNNTSKITLLNKNFFSQHCLHMNGGSTISKWLKDLPPKMGAETDVGSLILLSNDFTMEQGYLIQEAIKRCRYLYIFLIDSDTMPSSKDKKNVLEKYTEGYPVSILLAQESTRECYMWDAKLVQFRSMPARKFNPVEDTYTFVRYIAPSLGIKKYIVARGDDDVFEHRYNILKREMVLEGGMEWIEISSRL